MAEVPGSARLELVDGVAHLDEPAAVFAAMLAGWERQQRSRLLTDGTIVSRLGLLRRFAAFTESFPWQWTPADVEEFTMSLMSGPGRAAPSTIRGHHLTLRMFCDFLLDSRYGWVAQCDERFGQVPSQVCHDFNTAAHLVDYEGRPGRRPFTYDEIQQLFDFLDDRVDKVATSGRKGAWAALRDAQMTRPVTRSGCAAGSCACSTSRICGRTRPCRRGAPTARFTCATPRPPGAVRRGAAPC